MAVTTPEAELRLSRLRATPAEEAKKVPPVKLWAGLGALILAFCAYIVISWVTGPMFEPVKNDVSEPPTWMKVELMLWQVLSIPAALYLVWRFVVRPWRRERNIGVDGVLVLAFASMWVQDPWSSAGNHWFVYNTWLVNYGSWANELPWFEAFGKPGAMTSEPILFTPAAYVYIMLLGAALGCWVMRRARRRWPTMSNAALIGVCFVAMCLFDVVLEGLLWLPLGVFEYPGGHWALFPDTYHKYPLNEMLTIGSVFTAIAALRYFTNDRGETVVERGTDKLQASRGRKTVLRVLAVTAAVQIIMFLGYNVPNTLIGFNSTEWPADLQKRSYFTNNLCGQGTDRACPGPGMPHIRESSIYPGADGTVVVPSGGQAPKLVPFDRGKPGPADG